MYSLCEQSRHYLRQNMVIWKHVLYLLIFFKNCFDSSVFPRNRSFKGCDDSSNVGMDTFPPEQRIQFASSFHFKSLQCLHSLSIFPIYIRPRCLYVVKSDIIFKGSIFKYTLATFYTLYFNLKWRPYTCRYFKPSMNGDECRMSGAILQSCY